MTSEVIGVCDFSVGGAVNGQMPAVRRAARRRVWIVGCWHNDRQAHCMLVAVVSCPAAKNLRGCE